MPADRILECPFCGSPGEEKLECGFLGPQKLYAIECFECGFRIYGKSMGLAAHNWNRRTGTVYNGKTAEEWYTMYCQEALKERHQ